MNKINEIIEKIYNYKIEILILIIILYIIYRYKITYKLEIRDGINFDYPMYCIYIPQRKEYIQDFFDKYDLNVNMIEGINKKDININYLLNNRLIKKWNRMNEGRIACHNSHLNVLREFLKTDNERCIIFEDDLKSDYSKKSLIKIFNRLMNNLPPDCDMLYIGYCHENCNKTKEYNEYFTKAHSPVCRHAYSVNRKSAQLIIDHTSIMFNNGDEMVRQLIVNKYLKTYLSNYNIFQQNRENMGSNLGNNDSLPLCSNYR